jgi:glutathione S-transferase
MATDRAGELLLYSYWRSSSAYRVRIALNLKGVEYRQKFVHLVRDGGEQHTIEYRDINPLGLVPALVHGKHTIVQSMAIF